MHDISFAAYGHLATRDLIHDIKTTCTTTEPVSAPRQYELGAKARFRGRRPLACNHEGGHAVGRWYFGHRTDRAVVLTVEEVLIGRTIEDRRGLPIACEGLVCGYGICSCAPTENMMKQDPEIVRQWSINRDIDLTVSYAGVLAEAAHRRRSVFDCMWSGGHSDMAGVRDLLDAWKLSGAERAAVNGAAYTRAAALVRSPNGSAAIRAVASALMSNGEVDGDEIADLCRSAYDGRECAFGAWFDRWPATVAQIRAGYIPE